MEKNHQYTVLKSHRTDLVRHIELSLSTFAGPLCDNNVLNDDQYKDVKSSNGRKGAEKLVDCVLLSLETDSDVSKIFLEVLKSKGNKGVQTFVKKMELEINLTQEGG